MVLAEDLTAELAMPPFRSSVMDGYAVRTPIKQGDTRKVLKQKAKGFAG